MTRAERLLEIVRILHKRRYAVTAKELSQEFGISIRSIYRDMISLQQQGIPVEGEAGVGYLLREDFTLPPLMFTIEEMNALVIGAKWVLSTGDPVLAASAKEAIQKIGDIIPPSLKKSIDQSPLLIGYKSVPKMDRKLVQIIHEAIKNNHKLKITYIGNDHNANERTIWPVALGYFDRVVVLAAWCELREGFRHFRVDRIKKWTLTHEKYQILRTHLFQKWLDEQNIENINMDIGDY